MRVEFQAKKRKTEREQVLRKGIERRGIKVEVHERKREKKK